MSLPIFQRTIVDSSGNIQPGASVDVRNETTGDLVTIYADREGGTAKANPFLADSEGFATFYVEPGEYQVTATTPAGTITWSHVAIGDTALLQLAQPTGDTLVGSDDGASGSLWTTVAGFIARQQGERTGVNLLRYIPSAEWPAIASGTSTYDATADIQECLDVAGSIYIPIGTYITGPLIVRSGTTLTFAPGSVLKAKTGFGLNDRLLRIESVNDVTIFGNHGAVQMLKDEYVSGEQRHAVNISGSSRISIYNLIAKDSGGDGFYIGGNIYCEDVNLIGCIAENNRRQGLSIVNVINCNILGGHYKDTSGASPACGIDIESNLLDGYYLQNVNVIGVRTSNNAGGGILITPQSRFAPVSINVLNCTSNYDGAGAGGIGLKAAMAYRTVSPVTDPALIGKIHGKVTVRDCNIFYPQGTGIVSTNWTENAPETLVENVYVLNPYSNGGVTSIDRNKCGLLIRGELSSSGPYGSSVGNIAVKNLKVVDNRAVKEMRIPVYFEPSDEAVKPLKDITIDGIYAVKTEWTSASLTPFLLAGSLASTNVVINYGYDWIVESTSITPTLTSVGAKIATVTSSTFTLPSAANFIGSSFTFRHVNAGNLLVSLQVGDVIDNYSPSAGIGLIARKVGAEITLKAAASGRWQVVSVVGGWGVNPYYGDRIPTTYNTAAPVTGTWEQGDIVFNKTAASGGFVGWVCTTAGTPGTWKTFGPISA